MYVIEWFYWRALVHGTCETWESGIIFCYSSKIKFNHIILKQNPCNQIILTIYLKFKKDQTALKPGRFKRDDNKIRITGNELVKQKITCHMNLLRSYKKVPSSSPSPPPLLQPIFSFILLLLWFILFPTYMLWLRMGKNSSVIIPRENCIVYSLYSYFLLVFFFRPLHLQSISHNSKLVY